MAKTRKKVTRARRISVTTTATKIINSNPGRKAIFFSNLSASDVFVSLLPTVTTLLDGVRLTASGGTAKATTIAEGTQPQQEWYAIGAANVSIYVTEVLEINEFEDTED